MATRADARNEVRVRRVLCALIVAGSVWWLWSSSSPWNRPVWPVLGMAAAWLVLLAGVDEDALPRRARAASMAVLGVVTIGFIALVVVSPFGLMRFEGSFGPLERTANGLLDQPPDAYRPCGPGIEGLDYGGLGVPDEICVSNDDSPMSGSRRRVGFRWDQHTLAYEGGFRPLQSFQCVDHLVGPWWAEVPVDPSCPYGFTFSGMG